MRKIFVLLTIVTTLFLSARGYGQSSNATVSGTVSDATGALIPGVSITAANTATGVVTTAVSNDRGTYNLPALLPGVYTLSSELPGFQTQTYTDVQLGNAQQVRLNFTLQVSGVNTAVEVTVAADTILSTSSPTIGQVLTEQKVSDLPLVGNNVLDLIGVLNGVENVTSGTFGREGTTFAGVSAANVTTVRDGIMVQDTRWPTGINSATTINPDLVGEVRLILAPVDAEIGRGNGTVQIQTRSGTNQYRGSAVWSGRNTALDPNSWVNNRNPGDPILPNWSNTHQTTISFGGPIVRNKTFFYALFDRNDVAGRNSANFTVLTPCARNGIFRYFDNWNNGDAVAATTATGSNPLTSIVNFDGTPKAPSTNPNGSAHNGILRYASIFGPVMNTPARPDCSDAVIGTASTATGTWDTNRTQVDPTGYVDRVLGLMPEPNNFEAGDGLNTAGFRWLRRTKGLDNLWGVGEATGVRKQINVKVDHNFNAQHKANVNVSYERVSSDDTVMGWPDTFSNENFRKPVVVTSAFTSTLSPNVVNEARFGMRRTGTNVVAPWDLPAYQDDINAFLPPNVNGFRVIPRLGRLTGGGANQSGLRLCNPVTGGRPSATAGSGNCFANNITSTAIDSSPVWTYADTVSWTTGKHTLKFGGEFRFASSTSRVSSPGFFSDYKTVAQAVGGSTSAAAIATTGPNAISSQNPLLSGLAGGATGNSSNALRMRDLLNFMSGSLEGISHLYFLTDPKELDAFSDGRTQDLKTTELRQTEFSGFFKDDYKVHNNLTLNLGLRYEWYGVPYVGSGLTVSPVGGGAAAFGISGRDFSGWMAPGARADVTALEFIGPNSLNPAKTVYPNDWNNFGPAVGFAWQLPWFGAGLTTVRGGYQVTFQGGSRFGALETPLSNPPGSTYSAAYRGDSSNTYLDLTDLAAALPGPTLSQPMEPIALTDRSQSITAFDPNYVSPYVQNLTLSVTRSLRRNLTLDVRYVGTLARKQYRNLSLNVSNFLYNGLLDEFNSIRAGGESPLLDQMFDGINLCTGNLCGSGQSRNFGAVGTTVNGVLQTAALQMRSSSQFQSNLANGNYVGLANTLNTLNYVKTGGANPALPNIPAGVQGAVLRFNGFDENFIKTNPQFNNVTLLTNIGSNNYHSMQTEITLRPTQGFTGQATYTWSKNLGLANDLTNPVDRRGDYTIVGNNRAHAFRLNGNMELPLGPNRFLFGNSSGLLARLTERWQIGVIYQLSSGNYTSITANDMLYDNGVPDIVRPFPFDEAGVRWGAEAGDFLEGRYFDPEKFVKVDDPQCAAVTSLQNLSGLNPATGAPQARCTLDALAMIVPAGTADSFIVPDGSQRSAQIVLQHPEPGNRGTLGQNVLKGLSTFRFDANLSKSINITETKTLQVRIDALNVLNHPQPGNPNLSITGNAPFSQITNKTGGRQFQGQIRFNF